MPIKFTLRAQWLSEQEAMTRYTKVKAGSTFDIRAMLVVALLALACGGFVLWVHWQKLPTELIDMAIPFFCMPLAVALFFLYESRRCVTCYATLRRFSDSEKMSRRLMVCETCDTFFTEIVPTD